MIIDLPSLSQTSELRALWCEAFGDSEEFFDLFLNTAYSSKRCRVLMLDGSVVAAPVAGEIFQGIISLKNIPPIVSE